MVKQLAVITLLGCLLILTVKPAGHNYFPKIPSTNGLDTTLVFQGLPSRASGFGDLNEVTTWTDSGPLANNATNAHGISPLYIANVQTSGKQGLYFDGIDDYLQFPNSSSLAIAGPFTFSCWIYVTNTGITCVVLGGYGPGGLQGYGYGIGMAAGTDRPCVYSDAVGNWRVAGNPVASGTWCHIAVSVTGGNEQQYIDCIQQLSQTCGNPSAWSGQRTIGVEATTFSAPFKGFMRDFRIYNRALGSNEISAIFNANVD